MKLDHLPYLITPDELAALLRTTRKAIYGRVARSLIPEDCVVRNARRLLFRRDRVAAWLTPSRK